MLKKTILLYLLFFSISFANNVDLLKPFENQALYYTLNQSALTDLHKVSSFSIVLNTNDEMTFDVQTYRKNPNASIYIRGVNKYRDAYIRLTIIDKRLRGSMVIGERKYAIGLTKGSDTLYTITLEDKNLLNNVCTADEHKLKIPKHYKQITTNSVPNTASAVASDVDTEINVLILYTQDFANFYGSNKAFL